MTKTIYKQTFVIRLMVALLSIAPGGVTLAASQIKDISAELVGSNTTTVYLQLSETASRPASFTVENPSRLILDFKNTTSAIPNGNQAINVGILQSIDTVASGGRTRVVLNLTKSSKHTIVIDGSRVIVAFSGTTPPIPSEAEGATEAADEQPEDQAARPETSPETATAGITGIGFRRGDSGEGRILIDVSNPGYKLDVVKENGKLKLTLLNAGLPDKLERRLDVTDFDTPVRYIDSFASEDGTEISIEAGEDFTHFSYQNGNQYVVELRPVEAIQAPPAAEEPVFSGEKLSLNFQDIEVRTVLDIIAEFTKTNIIVSDRVQGRVTLRLNDVPWDQALNLILQSQGLALRRNGNIIRVAPAEELATQERLVLESQSQLNELSPIRSEVIPIKYATASELASLLNSDGGADGGGDSDTGNSAAATPSATSLITSRGRVIADDRTNTLIVYETSDQLRRIKELIGRLDQPVRQVMISARLVTVADETSRNLGSRFGFGAAGGTRNAAIIGGTQAGGINTANAGGFSSGNAPATGAGTVEQGLISNFAAGAIGGVAPASIALLLSHKNHQLLQLELSALETQGLSKTISSPRVITSDQQQASIVKGSSIPTQTSSASGGTTTTFVDANLSLNVTPRITPDRNVILNLQITNDSAPAVAGGNISTEQISTQVIVPDGDTVVLGGTYTETKTKGESKIPVLGDLPVIGQAFRSNSKTHNKSELLIFVTPKILPKASERK